MKTLKNIFAIITLLITFNSYSQITVDYTTTCGDDTSIWINPYFNVFNINNIDIACNEIKFSVPQNYVVHIIEDTNNILNVNQGQEEFNNEIITLQQKITYIRIAGNNTYYVVKVTNTTASVDENKMSVSELIAFPNPAVNQITVKFETNKTNMPISVYSLTGALVYRNEDTRDFGQNELIINTQHLKPGMYLLTVGSSTQKITIE